METSYDLLASSKHQTSTLNLACDGVSHDPGMEVKDMEVPECQKDHVNGSDVRDIIEKERLKGLKYAESWVELESLHDEFLGEGEATNGVVAMGGLNDIAGGGFSFP
ncbi:Thioesterase super member 6 [Aspergillus alliaceus]|uniref:Thioesterase super member 6 n=1 Tax=Petromyces alliaceus TaxID=209559 RepID=A0A8H6E3G1_PETAA|nr:Thioesterase super member 6 [Aspergillus burnettii]